MSITGVLYKKVFKPLAFKQDPEKVHDRITKLGVFLGKSSPLRTLVSLTLKFEHPMLRQSLLGIDFANPLGLAAGFDKNAELTDIMPAVGFGFAEVGSITGEPCEGNPKPRLWRLPDSESLMVYFGLRNDGALVIAKRLSHKHFEIPIGTSVAKTNSRKTVDTQSGINDYIKAYKALLLTGHYTTINISCPNAFGGQPFTDPGKLELLLSEIDKIKTGKPIFVKLSPDLSTEEVEKLIDVMDRHKVHGIICSNLTKRARVDKVGDMSTHKGGLSGKAVENLSNKLIRFVFQKTKGRYIIVGCGGIFNANDAYKKIKLGANLLQMITGMIYQGPQSVGEINRGLVELLKKDRFKNISEAVGSES